MPPYWAGFAEYMYRSYGDPRTEGGRKLFAERSPINKVENIKNGAYHRDPRNPYRYHLCRTRLGAAISDGRAIARHYAGGGYVIVRWLGARHGVARIEQIILVGQATDRNGEKVHRSYNGAHTITH
jgi:hypothetical protein